MEYICSQYNPPLQARSLLPKMGKLIDINLETDQEDTSPKNLLENLAMEPKEEYLSVADDTEKTNASENNEPVDCVGTA